jgi:hypothetical protein
VYVPFSSGAVIEFLAPCRVTNPLVDGADQVELLLANIRRLDGGQATRLKQALATFDCRTYTWRELGA